MDKLQESSKVGEDNTNSTVKDRAPSAMGSETDVNRDQNLDRSDVESDIHGDGSVAPDPSLPSDYSSRLEAHRLVFNEKFFGTDFNVGSPPFVGKVKSKVISGERIDEIIDALLKSDLDPDHYKTKYKSVLYEWKKYYIADYRELQKKYVLLRVPHNRKGDQKESEAQIVCKPEDIFDAIESCHREARHKKIAATFKLVNQYYYNITRSMVAEFIKLCPVCNVKPSKTMKKPTGAVHPLKSFQYRVRFQADLIDFNSNPQRDIDGVVRRWVLVIKDHFTKFALCRPLRRKTSALVKHELIKLLNEVGWPLIFHTDNGSEFCAKVITELIKDHPFICSVTGRTRIPSDQGSVERLNQEIKRIIDQIVNEHRLKGDLNFTWLDALPYVTEAINKTYGYGVGNLAPYTHVFGYPHKCPIGPPIPEDDKRHIHTVHDLASYSEYYDMKEL